MNLSNIDTIIFDLGGVVVNLDYNLTVIEFQKHIPNLDPSVFYGKEKQLEFFSKYEIGKISTDDFIRQFNIYYKQEIGLTEFKRCWNAMVLDLPITRIELIKSLQSKNKKVMLLSNINDLHADVIEDRFKSIGGIGRFYDLFDKTYYSHELGLRKPNQDIFKHVINSNSLAPEKTLFIDDSGHHVIGAKNLGINAVHLNNSDIERLISLT